MKALLPELEKMHMIEDHNRKFAELEKTRRQKNILKVLSRISWL